MVLMVFSFFIVLNIIAIMIPKKLTKVENYTTSIFALLFGINVDLILNLKYNMYGYFGTGFQWLGLIGEFLYFIPVNIIFLNFFPFNQNFMKKTIYILCWSFLSVGIEAIIEKTDFFNHHSWKLWYSMVTYPFVFLILILHLVYVRNLLSRDNV